MFIIAWIKRALSVCWEWTKSCCAWVTSGFISWLPRYEAPEYPQDAKCIRESRLGNNTIIYTLHMYGCNQRWYDITYDLDPKGEKESYSTLDAIKIAIQQKANLDAETRIVSDKIVVLIE